MTTMLTCDQCHETVEFDEGQPVQVQVSRQTHWTPAEYEEQFVCFSCIHDAEGPERERPNEWD